MKENARQGYWNGSRVPLGYTLEAVEQRGSKVKRRLVVDPVTSETIRLIFHLYLRGTPGEGPLSIKRIVRHLNERGYTTATGANFGTGSLHKILTNTVYIGKAQFNKRSSRTGELKPKSEVVTYAVPAIIDENLFEEVQRTLRDRSPQVVAPRLTTGPTLLTGLATCSSCHGAMTLRTGTSKSGRVYRYYSCSTNGRKGQVACQGGSIPMDKLDTLVTQHIVDRLLKPSRLAIIPSALTDSASGRPKQSPAESGRYRRKHR